MLLPACLGAWGKSFGSERHSPWRLQVPSMSYALLLVFSAILVQTLQSAENIFSRPLSSARHRPVSSLRRSPVRLTRSTPASPRSRDAAVCDELHQFWEVGLHACA